jgi:hypothetical protein
MTNIAHCLARQAKHVSKSIKMYHNKGEPKAPTDELLETVRTPHNGRSPESQ